MPFFSWLKPDDGMGQIMGHRPERFLPGATWPRFAYLPFAAGQHACIGAEFAQIELTIALACILQAWCFAPATPGPQPVRAGVTLTPADAVDLILERR